MPSRLLNGAAWLTPLCLLAWVEAAWGQAAGEGPFSYLGEEARASAAVVQVVGLNQSPGFSGAAGAVLLKFPLNDRGHASLAASAVVTAGRPIEALVLLAASQENPAFQLMELSKEKRAAVPLDLRGYRIRDLQPMQSWEESGYVLDAEALAYSHALFTAHQTPAAALARGARRDLTFAHFFGEPEKYRGQIAHVEGRMLRLRHFDPPPQAVEKGVRDLYEGWICDKNLYGANPMCLIFTELPAGLRVAEKLDAGVAFDGFFFKKYRYGSSEVKKGGQEVQRYAPLLIGRMPVLLDPPNVNAEQELSMGQGLVMIFLSLVAGTLFAALGMAFWYHRGDKGVRLRLARMNAGFWEDQQLPPAAPDSLPGVEGEPEETGSRDGATADVTRPFVAGEGEPQSRPRAE